VKEGHKEESVAYLHGRYLTVNCGCIACFAYRQIEQRQQTEYISKSGVQSIVVGGVVLSNVVQFGD
jgi:hypothetical protein